MSVLIYGAEIPRSCKTCMFKSQRPPGNTFCLITEKILSSNYRQIQYDGRHEECPLEQVPELIWSPKVWDDRMNGGK